MSRLVPLQVNNKPMFYVSGMVVLLLMGQWDKKNYKKRIDIITVYMLGLFVVPLGYWDFLRSSSCRSLRRVIFAHALPSEPPQAKKA